MMVPAKMKPMLLFIAFSLFSKVFATSSDKCFAQLIDDKINLICTVDETNSDGTTGRKNPLFEVTVSGKIIYVVCPLNFIKNETNKVGNCSCSSSSSSSVFLCTALLACNRKDVQKVIWKGHGQLEVDLSKLNKTFNPALIYQGDNNRSISNAPCGPIVAFLVIVALLAILG